MNEILKQNKTAFYVFDVKTLKDRVAYLRKMLPEDVAILCNQGEHIYYGRT